MELLENPAKERLKALVSAHQEIMHRATSAEIGQQMGVLYERLRMEDDPERKTLIQGGLRALKDLLSILEVAANAAKMPNR